MFQSCSGWGLGVTSNTVGWLPGWHLKHGLTTGTQVQTTWQGGYNVPITACQHRHGCTAHANRLSVSLQTPYSQCKGEQVSSHCWPQLGLAHALFHRLTPKQAWPASGEPTACLHAAVHHRYRICTPRFGRYWAPCRWHNNDHCIAGTQNCRRSHNLHASKHSEQHGMQML